MPAHDPHPSPSRRERRDEARARREAAERAEQAAKRRKRLLTQLAALATAAVVLVGGVALATTRGGPDAGTTDTASGLTGVAETRQLLAGIAQDGTTLGDPDAPATLTEFVDLQCPVCRDFTLQGLPTLVRDYVRTGKVKLELRTLQFLGPDSQRLAAAAQHAAGQDELFAFVELAYRNQGPENSGWATDDLLTRLTEAAGATPGRADRRAQARVAQAEREAQALGVQGTPSFVLTQRDGTPQRLELDALDGPGISRALDEALGAPAA